MAEKVNNENNMKTEEAVQENNKSEKQAKVDVQKNNEDKHSKEDGKKKKSKKDKKDDQIEALTQKLEEFSDKHLRLQAEFDNFRRRTMKEKADLIKSGGENVIVNILPVIDDFERAIDSLKNVPDENAGKQGTILIYNKFREFLKQNNVKEIDASNQEFDVDLHEAVTKIEVQDKELKGKVVDVIQKGYLLNDKVIRFAKVVIGD